MGSLVLRYGGAQRSECLLKGRIPSVTVIC